MISTEEKFDQDIKLSHLLSQMLLLLGFQAGNVGFNYLKRAIIKARRNQFCTLTEIYSVISAEDNKPVDAISSSVRNSIRSAYRQTNFKLLEELLNVKIFTSDYTVPAPREFIALINEYLKVFWNGESAIALVKAA